MNQRAHIIAALDRLHAPVSGLAPSTHVRETIRDAITTLATGAQTEDDINYARLLYALSGMFIVGTPSPYATCDACIQAAFARVQGPPAEPTSYIIERRHRGSAGSMNWTTMMSHLIKDKAWAELVRARQNGHKSYEYRMVAVY